MGIQLERPEERYRLCALQPATQPPSNRPLVWPYPSPKGTAPPRYRVSVSVSGCLLIDDLEVDDVTDRKPS